MVAMLGNDVRYRRPAIIGDTVTPEFTVTAIEPKEDDRGILRLAITLYNQRRELILEGTHFSCSSDGQAKGPPSTFHNASICESTALQHFANVFKPRVTLK